MKNEINDMMKILSFVKETEQLKNTLRQCWTSEGKQESTAEHTWRLCLMVMLFEKYLPELNTLRLMKMCLIHDLAEIVDGDIPAIIKVPNKSEKERKNLIFLIKDLPVHLKDEILSLWDDYENILSLESTLDKTYDGKAVNGPVVKAGDKVLAEETDYTLTYKDPEGNELSETPVNAGTYTVTVNGLGTYAGMNLNVTFTISPKAAELTVVADPSSAKYDGKSKTPEVTVKDGDKVLKEGTDYTLSYVYGEDAETKDFAGAEFVKEGNYTITVTGIGNYEGSTGKAVFTISKNNSASTDPTNPSNPNGDKNVTDKKVSNNTNNVKPVVKNVAAKNNKNVPKTGDNANVLLWIALAVISCGVLAGAGVAVRKRK